MTLGLLLHHALQSQILRFVAHFIFASIPAGCRRSGQVSHPKNRAESSQCLSTVTAWKLKRSTQQAQEREHP